jgi:hypothetical protein
MEAVEIDLRSRPKGIATTPPLLELVWTSRGKVRKDAAYLTMTHDPKPTLALGIKRQTLSTRGAFWSQPPPSAPVLSCSLSRCRGSGRVRFAALRGDGLHWRSHPGSSGSRPARPANSSASAGSSPNCERQSSMSDEAAVVGRVCSVAFLATCRVGCGWQQRPKGGEDAPSKNRTAHEVPASPFRPPEVERRPHWPKGGHGGFCVCAAGKTPPRISGIS